MPSFAHRMDSTGGEPVPAHPVCVRSRSLLPLDTQTSHVVVQRPHQNISQSYPAPSFPLDPALRGHAVAMLSSGSHNGMQAIPSPISPTSVSRLAVMQPHFQQGGAVRLLSQQYMHGIDPRMDPHMLRRAHSDYGPAITSHASDPQLLYNYHHLAAANQAGPPIGWATREVLIHSPSLPRQRSAKACKKCRKRKTKCSGGQPCTRCTVRGLECEYDEKSSSKGPTKARSDARKKTSKGGSNPSRTNSRNESHDDKSSEKSPLSFPDDKIPSVMQPAPGRQANPDAQTSQPFLFDAAPVPTLDSSAHLGDLNPTYAQYIANEPLAYGVHAATPVEIVDSTPLIQGYSVPGEPAIDGSRQNVSPGFDSDHSDGSRPNSACSEYSGSSSSASSYAQSPIDPSFAFSAPHTHASAWSASIPDYSFGRSIPPPLSASSSSSSLRDALLETTPMRPTSHSSSAVAQTSSTAASALTSVPSHASLSDSDHGLAAGVAPETSVHLTMPSASLTPTSTIYSDASGLVTSSSPSTSSSSSFMFEDVFNMSPDYPLALTCHNSTSFDAAAVDFSHDATVKARGSHQSLARSFSADMTSGFSSSTMDDLETNHVSDIVQFGGSFNMGAAVFS